MSENKKEIATVKNETVDLVLSRVQEFQKAGELDLPKNYSAANALKSAWLILQETKTRDKKPVLQACTRASIANALLDTVVQGLNPAKKQCYYIPYGSQLIVMRSYLGTKALCLRLDNDLDDIYAEVVYQGDEMEFRIERGQRIIETHKQRLENIDDDKIIAAYAVAVRKDGTVKRCELMTMDQIKKSWRQSQISPIAEDGSIKSGTTHGKFTGEMAKRTVTNRLAKHIIGKSSDSDLVIKSIMENDDELAEAEAQAEVEEYANTEVIDIQPHAAQVNDGPDELLIEGATEAEDEVPEDIKTGNGGPDF